MRSPGARRMIQTRVRSVSDSSVEPTQGFGFLRLALEFGGDLRRPLRFVLFLGGFVEHGQSHGISSDAYLRVIYSIFRQTERLRKFNWPGRGRAAVVIGGSMSGLLSALVLRRAGWDGGHLRAGGERTVRPRRRHRCPAGTDRAAARAGARDRRARRRHHHPQDSRPPRPADRRGRIARRCSPPGSASTGCCATPFRPSTITAGAGSPASTQGADSVTGAFFRWRNDRGRSAGRRRRHPLHRAPASLAERGAALCRLLRLARADRGKRHSARHPSRAVRVHVVRAAAGRAVPRLSGGRARQRPAPRPPPLQRGVVPAGGREDQTALAAHRRERRDACDLDPAAADPPRGDRRNARRRRAAAGAAVPRKSCG